MKFRSIVFGSLGLAVATTAIVVAQQQSDSRPKDPLSHFMQRKLEHAQGVLEGLSTGDLDLVAANADKLGLLCIDEDWNLVKSEEYVDRSTAFRRTIATLAKAARDKKLERAELAYVDLVGQCFSCHEVVRDGKRAK